MTFHVSNICKEMKCMGNVKVPGATRDMELIRMMEQYGAQLTGLCTAMLRDTQLAQDVVQDTFIQAYQKMDSFRGECSEKTWLTRIAINNCRNHLRSSWFRLVDRSITPDMLPEVGSQADACDRFIFSAVQGLPKKHREIILLRFYQDLTLIEIGNVLGISVSAVSRRLTKAMQLLKPSLEGWDFHE